MLTVVKWAMRLGAALILTLFVLGIHALMPDKFIVLSVLDCLGLGVVFLFAMTLIVSSFLIGSAPGRSRLGHRLQGKVDAQAGTAKEVYEQAKTKARTAASGEAQTTVRPAEEGPRWSGTPLR